jgi:hypothetical protein
MRIRQGEISFNATSAAPRVSDNEPLLRIVATDAGKTAWPANEAAGK